MSKIKTREIAEKSIKTLDKAAVAGERMKNTYIRTKESAVGSVSTGQESANEYAGNKVEYAAEDVSREVVHDTGTGAQKAMQRGREAFKKQREKDLREKARENSASTEQPATSNDTPADVPTPASNSAGEPSAASGVEARPHQLDNVTTDADHLPRPARDVPHQETPPTPEQRGQRLMVEKSRVKAAETRDKAKNESSSVEHRKDAAGKQAKTWTESSPQVKGRSVPIENQEQPVIRNRGSLRVGHQTAKTAEKPVQVAERAGKATARSAQKTVKQTKRAVKTAERSTKAAVKTAERTAKTTIKTAEATAKATQRMAQATAKAARVAAQAARAAAKAAVATAKATAKAVAAAVKATIAAVKALVAAIAAGGWVAVLAIVIICLIGLLVGSVFGIFFSGEDTGTGQTMQTAVQEINAEYQDQLTTIRSNNAYDILEMSGTRAVWREVLAVYAVKTTTDPDNPQDVASMDDSKKALLKDIFWAMNTISSRTANETRNLTTETDDGSGNIVETTTPTAVTVLYISVAHKTAEEMADYYGFNEEQRAQLAELLADEYQSLWSAVLYGIGTGDGLIVEVALAQIGNVGGEPYWSWYGFGSRVEWCACFVSWCANESGYIEAGIIPKFSGCVGGSNWFKDRGLWQDNSYEPRPGDIIFFDWDDPDGFSGPQDGLPDHVGIVERVENGIVYTVEGNSGDRCQENHYPIGYYEIYGYGTPAY